jgi:hypothetical protein
MSNHEHLNIDLDHVLNENSRAFKQQSQSQFKREKHVQGHTRRTFMAIRILNMQNDVPKMYQKELHIAIII